jgi:hypothetical protein
VTGDNAILPVNEDRVHKAEMFDAGRNLLDLLGTVSACVRRSRFQLSRMPVSDFEIADQANPTDSVPIDGVNPFQEFV